jgi:hypothetical protein
MIDRHGIGIGSTVPEQPRIVAWLIALDRSWCRRSRAIAEEIVAPGTNQSVSLVLIQNGISSNSSS